MFWQTAFIALLTLTVGVAIIYHDTTIRINFWRTLLEAILWWWIVWMGGFFG